MWCPVCGHAVIPSNNDVLYCTHKDAHGLEYNVYGALVRVARKTVESAEVVIEQQVKLPAPAKYVEVDVPPSAKTEIPPAPKVQPIGKKAGK